MSAEGIPWVVVAVDPWNPQGAVLIHVIEESNSWIEVQDRDYLDELLVDWRITLNKDATDLLEFLRGLSIGPLRTSASGQCTKEELGNLTRTLAEKVRRLPPRSA